MTRSFAGMKVSYRYGDDPDRVSTAYLKEPPLEDGSYVGTNKHSDLPVHVRWDDDPKQKTGWIEVCTRKWDIKDVYNETWEEDVEARSNPECECLKEGNA